MGSMFFPVWFVYFNLQLKLLLRSGRKQKFAWQHVGYLFYFQLKWLKSVRGAKWSHFLFYLCSLEKKNKMCCIILMLVILSLCSPQYILSPLFLCSKIYSSLFYWWLFQSCISFYLLLMSSIVFLFDYKVN